MGAETMRTIVALAIAWIFAATFGARADDRAVTVYAAASLTGALQDIGKDYEAETGVQVKFSFAASSLLARQIEAGAEADIFFSADAAWMDYLAGRSLVKPETRKTLLSNRLVLIAAKENPVKLEIKSGFPLARALGDGRLAVADPDSVPAGRYARGALTSLGVWDSVSERLVRAENVRVALTYVARGEAPLGIVYVTDALAEPQVRTVDVFPASSHPPVVYPAALTATSASASARAFLTALGGETAAAVFTRYGFAVLP